MPYSPIISSGTKIFDIESYINRLYDSAAN